MPAAQTHGESIVLDCLVNYHLLLLSAVLPYKGNLLNQVVRSLLHPVLMLYSKKNRTIDKHYVVNNPNQGWGWGLITHISTAAAILAGCPSDTKNI